MIIQKHYYMVIDVMGVDVCYGLLQPVGFVTFSSRTDAEAAMEDLQVSNASKHVQRKAYVHRSGV